MEIVEIIQNFIFTIYGGFVGAIFGLYAAGQSTGKQLWFLIAFYGILVLIIVLILNRKKNGNIFKKN